MVSVGDRVRRALGAVVELLSDEAFVGVPIAWKLTNYHDP